MALTFVTQDPSIWLEKVPLAAIVYFGKTLRMKMSLSRCITLLISLLITLNFSCKKNPPSPSPHDNNVNLKKGLLLYLPFDGNIADSSGNNNTVQSAGGGVLTYDEHGYW